MTMTKTAHADPTDHAHLSLFPTPVLSSVLPDARRINAELVEWVRGLQRDDGGMQRTNVGGWHSNVMLAQRPDPVLQGFLTHARSALSLWAMQCFALSQPPDPAGWQIELWANVNRRGHHNRAHDHLRSGVIASAFYYVQCGGTDVAGRTVFVNQQSVPSKVECAVPWRDHEWAVTPTDGVLMVFPSWLGHRVEPFEGDGDRITLALNAGHAALPIKRRGDRPLPGPLKRLLGRA